MAQAPKYKVQPQKSPGADEGEKVPVVSPSNAIVDPSTVVILGLNTIITDSTMVASRRAPDIASFTIFGRILEGDILSASLDVDPLRERWRNCERVVRISLWH